MHTALTGAPAAWAPNHRLFIVNDENRWEIAGSYQIARCVKVPGRRALSVGNGHGWKASFAKAGVAGSNPAGGTGQAWYLVPLIKVIHRLWCGLGGLRPWYVRDRAPCTCPESLRSGCDRD